MKRILSLIVAVEFCLFLSAGLNDLLWDFSVAVPEHSPERGLTFSSTVSDPEGTKNGLKGIKLNSSGWCSFSKEPVAGILRLTFGPRSGRNIASLRVYTETDTLTTCGVRSSRTVELPLTEAQNHIYITRAAENETVLERIEFVAGLMTTLSLCEEEESPLVFYSADMPTDTFSSQAAFLLNALREANRTGHKTIYLPNGVYDLGAVVLTAIEADHVSLIGESRDGVIIRNAPDYRYESIDKSATLRIAPGVEGTYLQNLTIQNALDYYRDNNGRAVALWDQGTKTVCKNVRLLSHQDTYYSDCEGGLRYFEDCEIHGTVDFICGNGNVYFKHCLLYCEPRSKNGDGADALTASNAGKTDKGFVFEGCRVQSVCPRVSLGRSWKNEPKCVFLNTTIDTVAGVFGLESNGIQRWTLQGMSTLPAFFGEYNTTDTEGRAVSPESNRVTFTYRGTEKTMNTILSPEKAAQYTMEQVLGDWAKEANETTNQFNQHKLLTQ